MDRRHASSVCSRLWVPVLLFVGLAFATGAAAQGLSGVSDERQREIRSQAVQRQKDQALATAIKANDVELTRKALADGANVNVKDTDGSTPLMFVSRQGFAPIASLLLETRSDATGLLKLRADVNAENAEGATALMNAAYEGHLAVAEILVKAGANLNHKESHGYTALALARRNGKVEVSNFLEAESDALNKAFVEALLKGDEKAVKESIGRGADVNSRDEADITPLIFAAQTGKPEIATVLLDAGATVDAATKEGGTALMYAANRGDLPIVQMLVGKGANLDAHAPDGSTALTLAEKAGHRDVVRFLQFAGRKGTPGGGSRPPRG